LHNLDLDKAVIDARGKLAVQEMKLKNLEAMQREDPTAKAQIPAAELALADLRQSLSEREENQRRLIITAPVPGTVLPPASQPSNSPEGGLARWSGSPLDEKNREAFLETGTLFCLIGEAEKLEAVLIIDQGDVQFVRQGQKVRLKLDERPGEILTGIVREVAEIDLKVTPRELLQHEDVPTRMNEQGRPELISTSYQARVELDGHDYSLLNGTTGTAKIEAAPQSLAARLSRYLSRTFRLDASLSK
jgi:putative peptide zinc metalloprotease protein